MNLNRLAVVFGMILVVLLYFGNTLSAAELNTTGLSEEQLAQLALQAAQMKKNITENVTTEKVNEWVDVGKNVGIALAATAGELGVAVDEFLKSTTGKITVVLIIWKVAGKEIMGLFVGMTLIVVFTPMWFYFFRRMCVVSVSKIEYPEKGFKKIKTFEYHDGNNANMQVLRFVMAVVLFVGVAISLLCIF